MSTNRIELRDLRFIHADLSDARLIEKEPTGAIETESFPNACGYVAGHLAGVTYYAAAIVLNTPAEVFGSYAADAHRYLVWLDSRGTYPALVLWGTSDVSEVIEQAFDYARERGWIGAFVTAMDLGVDEQGWQELLDAGEIQASDSGDFYDSTNLRLREVFADVIECEVCGEVCEPIECEPEWTHEPSAQNLQNHAGRVLISHGHYLLAQYDYGHRTSDEMAAVILEELGAAGAPLSEVDREVFLSSEPDYELAEWAFVYDAVEHAEWNLPAGLVAISSADAGTWTLWAQDRETFLATLARYSAAGIA